MESEDPLKSHESTKRVLFHLVNCYQQWRNTTLGVPNEFTDDAVRIGEQHLREVDWFPVDEGWLADNKDTSPRHAKRTESADVLSLIDAELRRLKGPPPESGSRRWRKGVVDGRNAAAQKLQKIRDAYVMESIVRETERLGLYDVEPKVISRD